MKDAVCTATTIVVTSKLYVRLECNYYYSNINGFISVTCWCQTFPTHTSALDSPWSPESGHGHGLDIKILLLEESLYTWYQACHNDGLSHIPLILWDHSWGLLGVDAVQDGINPCNDFIKVVQFHVM